MRKAQESIQQNIDNKMKDRLKTVMSDLTKQQSMHSLLDFENIEIKKKRNLL